MDLSSTGYNMPNLISLPYKTDKRLIKNTLRKLISRHENFRTSFQFLDEIPVQIIHNEVEFEVSK